MNDPKVLDLLIVDDEVLETEYLLTLLPKTGFRGIFDKFLRADWDNSETVVY